MNNKGFSLLEILIAITLVGVVGGFVATNLFGQLEEGKVSSAINQIRGLRANLMDYKRNCNRYPSTLEGLIENTDGCKRFRPGGYMAQGTEEAPLDPWGEPYAYESDGRKYTIISYGADSTEGGDGFDADINSNDL